MSDVLWKKSKLKIVQHSVENENKGVDIYAIGAHDGEDYVINKKHEGIL